MSFFSTKFAIDPQFFLAFSWGLTRSGFLTKTNFSVKVVSIFDLPESSSVSEKFRMLDWWLFVREEITIYRLIKVELT